MIIVFGVHTSEAYALWVKVASNLGTIALSGFGLSPLFRIKPKKLLLSRTEIRNARATPHTHIVWYCHTCDQSNGKCGMAVIMITVSGGRTVSNSHISVHESAREGG